MKWKEWKERGGEFVGEKRNLRSEGICVWGVKGEGERAQERRSGNNRRRKKGGEIHTHTKAHQTLPNTEEREGSDFSGKFKTRVCLTRL